MYTFRTIDHPEADGRKPREGECEYSLTFPLEDEGTLRLRLGQIAFDSLKVMMAELEDEAGRMKGEE